MVARVATAHNMKHIYKYQDIIITYIYIHCNIYILYISIYQNLSAAIKRCAYIYIYIGSFMEETPSYGLSHSHQLKDPCVQLV